MSDIDRTEHGTAAVDVDALATVLSERMRGVDGVASLHAPIIPTPVLGSVLAATTDRAAPPVRVSRTDRSVRIAVGVSVLRSVPARTVVAALDTEARDAAFALAPGAVVRVAVTVVRFVDRSDDDVLRTTV